MTRTIFITSTLILLAACAHTRQPSDPMMAGGPLPDDGLNERTNEATPANIVVGLRPHDPENATTMSAVEPSLSTHAIYFNMNRLEDVCDDVEVHFAVDSAELDAGAEAELEKVADCFEAHEIRSIDVVGHTDERGTEPYNEALGLRRALRVASFLRGEGVEEPQIEVISRGESAARWRAYWQDDRRVEVVSEPAEDDD